MKIWMFIISLIVTVFCLVAFTNKTKPSPVKFVVPKGWPKPMYNFKENPLTKEGIALGRMLFYDEILSKDSSISCATCHQQYAAFSTYDHNLSHGINNAVTNRNAPALQNLAWQKEFMLDGGINHLDAQALAPLTAENEMAETIENVIKKLQRSSRYKAMFKAAFGTEEITTQKFTKAISQFVLTLVSSNSKYDRVMRGEDTFILPEKLGYDIFKQKCVSCHKEPFFTDFSYRHNGMPLDEYIQDEGRKVISRKSEDSLKFRVPSLRNVGVTAPYGHDGRFYGLYNVFEHYRNKMQPSATTDSLLKNKLHLSNFQIGQLTAFLRTLTDSSFLQNEAFMHPLYGKNAVLHNH
jgi:cytochrome c peroxidase